MRSATVEISERCKEEIVRAESHCTAPHNRMAAQLGAVTAQLNTSREAVASEVSHVEERMRAAGRVVETRLNCQLEDAAQWDQHLRRELAQGRSEIQSGPVRTNDELIVARAEAAGTRNEVQQVRTHAAAEASITRTSLCQEYQEQVTEWAAAIQVEMINE